MFSWEGKGALCKEHKGIKGKVKRFITMKFMRGERIEVDLGRAATVNCWD
jgi:hypothetical protein